MKFYLGLGSGGLYSLAPKRIYARLTRRRLAASIRRRSKASPGPRPVDPYLPPRAVAAVDTVTHRIVDPARGVSMECTVRSPSVIDGPLPVVVYSVPMDWSPTATTANGIHISEHLAAAGYLVVTVRHTDTDRIIFPEYPGLRADKARYGLTRVEDTDVYIHRIQDLRFVLDTLEAWNASGPFQGAIDLARIGMSGHSYGGLIAMTLAGQRVGPNLVSHRDPRVKAVATYGVMASPPGSPAKMFSDIEPPALCIVGAGDFTYGRWYMAADKLAAFHHCNAPHRYAVWLDLADHHTYPGGRNLIGKGSNGELLCQQWIRCIALAFWDAWLRDDPAARRWLDEDLAGLLKGDGTLQRK